VNNRSSQLIEGGSKEELTVYIDELSAQMSDISRQLVVLDPLPVIAGFVVTIMGYIATQGFRLASWLREPHVDSIDLVAHTTRNLFEASLTYRHLMVDGGQHFMDRLTTEIARDELDIVKESLRRFEATSAPPELVSRQRQLEATNPPKIARVSDLAEETGAKSEYDAYYKFFSKYSHPSLYLLVGDRRQVYSQYALRVFTERAVTYLEVATNDYERLRDVILKHNQGA
jgi:hypothetical protein